MKKLIKLFIVFLIIMLNCSVVWGIKLQTIYMMKFQIDSSILLADGAKFDIDKVDIDKDNEKVVPFIDNETNEIYLPLRIICLINYYTIEWNEETFEIILTKKDDVTNEIIKISIGSKQIYFSDDGGETSRIIETDIAPSIYHDWTYVSTQTMTDIMNYCTYWKESSKEIFLIKKHWVEKSDYIEKRIMEIQSDGDFIKLVISAILINSTDEEMTSRAYICFKEGCDEETIYSALGENVTIKDFILDMYWVDFHTKENLRESIIRLNELPYVEFAEPVYYY